MSIELWTRFNPTWYGTTLWRTHCVFGLKYAGHKIWRQNGSKKGQVTARAMGKKEARSNDASSPSRKNSSVPFSSIDWTPSIVAMLGLQCILYKFGGLGCFEILLSLTVTKEYRILTMESKKMKRGVYAHEALIKIEYVTKFMEKISAYNLSRRTLHAVRSEGSEKSFRNS